ncbi:metallophosphoesterase [Eikenella sp. S3360]|uniref:Metallophosphoesterase n=1 Tax=Eikenella glucosivorans TaxID=2766967 RepID=A0ABS0ND99_9NEIS|nr:metallophosphoesterase [Eikenella glucosivorans]MBH5330220.1 metallophosphoesterase [Eikenella glucosivorans]
MWWVLALVVLVMQLFGWLFGRGLIWLLDGYLKKGGRRVVWLLVFGVGNGLFALSFLRVWPLLFRLISLWMVVLLYGVLTMLAVWLLGRLLRLKWPPERTARLRRVAAVLLFGGLFALSLYNAYTPVVRHYSVRINKPLGRPVRIGMASDLHLGVLFGSRQIDELVRIMQRERVDIILLPGDLMDDDTEAYRLENMQPHLQRLRAPLGVYATLGNHDLFGHQAEIAAALQEAGITVLHDSAVLVDQRFWVVGRPDEMDTQRADTADLLAQTDTAQPVFLLDHRPTSIAQHEKLPIDIQMSGHVHNGQIFPANLLVKLLNDLAYGYEARGQGHYFVTSGYGFWGVPLRLGSQSEVVVIDVAGE